MPIPAAPDTAASTCFDLLGPLTVTVDGTAVPLGGPRQVAVLARLLLSPGQVVSIEALCEAVWDGDAPARPEVALRSYLSNLRRSIEPDRRPGDRRSCIESVPPGYRIMVAPTAIDAVRFEELVRRGRQALSQGDPAEAVALTGRAVALWRGEPCEGVPECDAVAAFRSRLEELRLVAAEVSFEARLALGEHETVAADLEPVLAEHPLRERLTGLAMLALYRAGRQSEALAACQALRHRLVERLGVDPGPPIQDLERRILSHDPSLEIAEPAVGPSVGGSAPGGETAGGAEPVVPVVDRPGAAPAGSNGPGPGESGPVVGRARELAVLAGAVQALSQGRGASVLLSGEPGSGRTTLVGRLAEQVQAIGGIAGWGHCRSVAADQVLWPWAQILERLAPAVAAAGVTSPGDLAGLAPSLDPGPRTPAEAAALFPAVVELLRRLAARTPVLVVLDDAHWADEASIELAAFAATALADDPVTIAVTWCDTELAAMAARPALRQLAGLAVAQRVVLGGLEPVAVLELLSRGAEVGSQELLARALTRAAAGNPFLVKELIAAWWHAPDEVRAGTPASGVDADAEVERLTAALCELAVTTRIRDLLLNRVDQSHREARTVLAAAALVRGPFGPGLLADVTGLEAAVVEAVLDTGTRTGLLAEDGPARQAYRFVHPVTARILSAEIPGPRTGRLHAAIAHSLWRHDADPALLAHHFSRAGTSGTSLLAARFALASVHHAGRLDSLVEAGEVIDRGLAAVPHPDDTDGLGLDLALFAAHLAQLRGDRRAFEEAAERSLVVAREADDPVGGLRAALAVSGPQPDGPHLGTVAWVADDLDRDWAVSVAGDALELEAASRWAPLLERRLVRLRGGPTTPAALQRPVAHPEVHHGTAGSPADPWLALATWREGALHALEAGPGAWAEPEIPMPVPRLAPVIHDQLLALRLRLLGGGSPAAGPVTAAAGQAHPLTDDTDEGADAAALGRPLRWGRRGHAPDLAELDLALTGVTIDLLAGRLSRAAAGLEPMLTWCDRTGVAPDAVGQLAALIAWEQGRTGDLARITRQRLGRVTGPAVTAWRAVAAAGAGDRPTAASLLDGCPTVRVADPLAPVGDLCLLALAAHGADHRPAAEAVLPRLLARRTALATRSAGLVVLGPVAWYAALAALALDRVELAGALLADAERAGRAVGAPQWHLRLLVARAEQAVRAGNTTAAEAARVEARAAAGAARGWLDRWPGAGGIQSDPNRFATR